MRTRGNQLLIQILLMIIITVIVAYLYEFGRISEYVFRSDRKGNYSNQCGILIKV